MRKIIDRRRFLQGSAAVSLAQMPSSMSAMRAIVAAAPAAAGKDFTGINLGHPLMVPALEHSLGVRCLSKPVSKSLMLDDMEEQRKWTASPELQLSYTTERARSGTRSLRMTTLLRNEAFIRATTDSHGHFTGQEAFFFGQPFSSFAVLGFDQPQDWTAFNRLSLWCYLHPTASPTTSISLQFLCAGASAGPWDPLPIHFIGDLKPGEWNHLTWEISEYPRDKVVMLVVMKPCSGLPIATSDPAITFDLDELRLEKVEVEPVSSWQVTRGKVAYSHVGYRLGAQKLAYCSEEGEEAFRVLHASSGDVVAELPTQQLTNARGKFTVLDFTSVATPGIYRLDCGKSKGEAFPIGDDAWNALIDATLNSFQGFRCGCGVPGSHDACHLDTFVEYQGERRIMAGGWHDAANNTQFADSTHTSIYALLSLYEQLIGDPLQAKRCAAILEEAKWGLDWSLRMRFAPGVRLHKNNTSYWTDSKVGTLDDVLQFDAGNDLRENIYALVALSLSARILKTVDARMAARVLRVAEEDYDQIRPAIKQPFQPTTYGDSGRGSWRDLAAYLAVCATELYRVTGKESYRADAIRFGGWLIALQEQSFVDGSPVTGYFYADRERTQIQREVYGGSDDSGFLALRALCEAFPNEESWMQWYAGLLIYSEYYCRQGGEASAPFDVIPTCVWRREDLTTDNRPDMIGGALSVHASPMFPTPVNDEVTRKQRLQMYEAGAALTSNMRLRVFPIWYNHVQHGATTGHLNRAAGLGCAAAVRGRLDVAELAGRQLQWVVGSNPFSRSIMFGVGYDYWQNFTVDNVNFVGGMGLGLNSYEADMPAWPNNAVFPYKEQWSYSSGRMALNLAQCGAPARLVGKALVAVSLREDRTGKTTALKPGSVDVCVAPGQYVATGGGMTWRLDLIGGRRFTLVFDPKQAITFSLSQQTVGRDVAITAELNGAGTHSLELRLFNLSGPAEQQSVSLTHGTTKRLSWKVQVAEANKPWIAVVKANTSRDTRQEVFGRLGAFQTVG